MASTKSKAVHVVQVQSKGAASLKEHQAHACEGNKTNPQIRPAREKGWPT